MERADDAQTTLNWGEWVHTLFSSATKKRRSSQEEEFSHSLMRLAYMSARRRGLPFEEAQDCGVGFVVHMLPQEALLTRVRSGEKISPAWLYTCAEYWATNFVRRYRRLCTHERLTADMSERTFLRRDAQPSKQETGSPELQCLRSELRRRVLSAALSLTASQNRLFTQRCLHGCSIEEIACQTGRTPNAVKQSLAITRRRLQTLLIRDGLTLEEIGQYLHLIASGPAQSSCSVWQAREE